MRARGKEQFWDELHSRWRGEDPRTEREAVRSVLTHLTRRLPGPEARHLADQLPADVKELWPSAEAEYPGRQRPAERAEVEEFALRVERDAGLSDLGAAEDATRSVFYALGRFLDAEERSHISAQLPSGLRRLWDDATR